MIWRRKRRKEEPNEMQSKQTETFIPSNSKRTRPQSTFYPQKQESYQSNASLMLTRSYKNSEKKTREE